MAHSGNNEDIQVVLTSVRAPCGGQVEQRRQDYQYQLHPAVSAHLDTLADNQLTTPKTVRWSELSLTRGVDNSHLVIHKPNAQHFY